MNFPVEGYFLVEEPNVIEHEPNVDLPVAEEEGLYGSDDELPAGTQPNATQDLATMEADAPVTQPVATSMQPWPASAAVKVEATSINAEDELLDDCTDETNTERAPEVLTESVPVEPPQPDVELALEPPVHAQPEPKKSDVLTPDDADEMYELFGEAFTASRVEPPDPVEDVPFEPPLGSRVLEEVVKLETEGVDAMQDEGVVAELDEVRKKLGELAKVPVGSSDGASILLQDEDMPHELYIRIRNQAGPGVPIGESLTTRSSETTEPLVDNETLLEVVRWHNQRFATEAAQFQEDLPAYIALAGSSILRGVNEGWLPPEAMSRPHRFKAETRIKLDDGVNLIPQGYHAAYHGNGNRIDIRDPDPETLLHEEMHACHRDTTFFTLLSNPQVSDALKEATVTLAAQAALDRRDIFDTRPFRRDTYNGAISLMDALCRYGDEPIDVRRFTDVLFEDWETGLNRGSKAAYIQLREALYRNFSPDVMRMLNTPGERGEEDMRRFRYVIWGSTTNRAREAREEGFMFTSQL